ncbi:MAG: Holliday junction resolvase RuvX [Parcubacteria group bacterium]|nr:Holliday junction resolvase RuvX [Parcubacteria group bacterium]
MVILGLDYGSRRIGVAVADTETKLAVPVTTLLVKDDADGILQLSSIITSRKVERIIVGLPLNLSGGSTRETELVRDFIGRLRAMTRFPIESVDERLSSQQSEHLGVAKASRDAVAAQLILQTYLDKYSKA